jgi:hypothetical protein
MSNICACPCQMQTSRARMRGTQRSQSRIGTCRFCRSGICLWMPHPRPLNISPCCRGCILLANWLQAWFEMFQQDTKHNFSKSNQTQWNMFPCYMLYRHPQNWLHWMSDMFQEDMVWRSHFHKIDPSHKRLEAKQFLQYRANISARTEILERL